MPYFASSRGPVTVNDSLLLDNDVAVGIVRCLVTPRNVHVLGTRDDNRVVSDVMALSMQSAASVASVGHHLIAKSHEMSLKRERTKTAKVNRRQLEILQEENQKLSKMVDFYSQDMQKQLEALDRPSRKQQDHDTSYAQAKGVIFGSSSDEPQEAACENPREEVQMAKLKALIAESRSVP
ncbi:unnamed protein product [Prunus armeniaca]